MEGKERGRGGEMEGEGRLCCLLWLSKKKSTLLLGVSCLLKPAITVTTNSS